MLTIVGVIAFSIASYLQHRKNVKEGETDCYAELNREIKGTVAKAFFDDDINVKAFVIYFTNNKRYVNPIFEKSLSDVVNPGDSIYKRAGGFKFLIYKNADTNSVTVIKDTVDCVAFYNR